MELGEGKVVDAEKFHRLLKTKVRETTDQQAMIWFISFCINLVFRSLTASRTCAEATCKSFCWWLFLFFCEDFISMTRGMFMWGSR
jgi:hypothetical protein